MSIARDTLTETLAVQMAELAAREECVRKVERRENDETDSELYEARDGLINAQADALKTAILLGNTPPAPSPSAGLSRDDIDIILGAIDRAWDDVAEQIRYTNKDAYADDEEKEALAELDDQYGQMAERLTALRDSLSRVQHDQLYSEGHGFATYITPGSMQDEGTDGEFWAPAVAQLEATEGPHLEIMAGLSPIDGKMVIHIDNHEEAISRIFLNDGLIYGTDTQDL